MLGVVATFEDTEGLSQEELQLAARNHGMPLEALRYAITPAGLHYLLVHYDIPAIDPGEWRLVVDGEVERTLSLDLDALHALPAVTSAVTMECAGNGRALLSPRPKSQPWLLEAVGTARWTGVPLRAVLERAGLRPSAVEVVFTGLDRGFEGDVDQRYQRSLTMDEAMRDEVLLAYEMNGAPLPPQHGFPLRLVVPGWYGMTNVKWLGSVTVLEQPFTGYQQMRSYRLREHDEDDGVPVDRMLPRALILPPGIPDFMSRERTVEAGAVELRGRAWSGKAPIESVEVSTDGGRSWAPAEVSRDESEQWAWCAWTYRWEATPGSHMATCRASDAAGNRQPAEPRWNVGGYSNNAFHQVPVRVVEALASESTLDLG
jgi:DMSO/TMAO reductase YedYZ molybdopterin-dependent catalytic subunit